MVHRTARMTPTQQNVLNLYRQDRNVVNSDALLLTRYWHEFNGWDADHGLLGNMVRVTPAATITRARRKLHEMGLIVYSKEAHKRREKRYKEAVEEHSNFLLRFLKIK